MIVYRNQSIPVRRRLRLESNLNQRVQTPEHWRLPHSTPCISARRQSQFAAKHLSEGDMLLTIDQ